MDAFVIQGGRRLRGEVEINGSKNAALPIMAASLLTKEECVIRGVPDLADVRHLCSLLESLGANVRRDKENALHIQVEDESHCLADYETVRRMRASICVLGPMLARRHRAEVETYWPAERTWKGRRYLWVVRSAVRFWELRT